MLERTSAAHAPAWSRPLPAPPAGLSLARGSRARCWSATRSTTSAATTAPARSSCGSAAPASLVAAVIADDGRTVAAAGKRGQVWLLTLDFVQAVGAPRAAPAGGAGAGRVRPPRRRGRRGGGVTVFDRDGREVWRAAAPRPLVHLAFVPELPVLLGSAEFGLVCAFDDRGQVHVARRAGGPRRLAGGHRRRLARRAGLLHRRAELLRRDGVEAHAHWRGRLRRGWRRWTTGARCC